MDWLDLLAVQGTLKSLLQYHSSKASIFRCSAFFIVQISHPYMTTGKTIALTGWTFVGKVISLLFNVLSRLIIAILPRSKHLLISWLQSPFAVILEPHKIKSATVSTVSPSVCMNWWDQIPWSQFSECWVWSQLFHFLLSNSSRVSWFPLHFLSLEWYHLHIWGSWYFLQKSWFQLMIHPPWHFAWCTPHRSYISKMTIYSLVILLSQFGTSQLFHVQL